MSLQRYVHENWFSSRLEVSSLSELQMVVVSAGNKNQGLGREVVWPLTPEPFLQL